MKHGSVLPLICLLCATLLGLVLRLLAYAIMMLLVLTSRVLLSSVHWKGMHCKTSLSRLRVKSGLIILRGAISSKTHAPGMALNATTTKSLS